MIETKFDTDIGGVNPEDVYAKFPWLRVAEFRDAVVDIRRDFLIWYSGKWIKGTWKGGLWRGGENKPVEAEGIKI
jgi:hypothetical protein